MERRGAEHYQKDARVVGVGRGSFNQRKIKTQASPAPINIVESRNKDRANYLHVESCIHRRWHTSCVLDNHEHQSYTNIHSESITIHTRECQKEIENSYPLAL